MSVHMVSPPHYVFGPDGQHYTVYGWYEEFDGGRFEPIVGNPDGPGMGRWSLYHGEDAWTTG